MNNEALLSTAAKVDNAARHCAKALGATATIKTTPGYLPMHQNRLINDIIRQNMLKYCSLEDIHDNEISMAAGDIGDLSLFKPTVQFGYSGFKGNCHGKDLCICDEERAYLEPSEIVYNTVQYLLEHPEYVERILKEFKPEITMEEYLAYLNR